jgi:hypothetical protein
VWGRETGLSAEKGFHMRIHIRFTGSDNIETLNMSDEDGNQLLTHWRQFLNQESPKGGTYRANRVDAAFDELSIRFEATAYISHRVGDDVPMRGTI